MPNCIVIADDLTGANATGVLLKKSGFNTMTLLPTEDVKAHILPQYRRITDLVHNTGRPFLLHSCGNLFAFGH